MLALNEIRRRACEFVLNWKEKAAIAREEADAQTKADAVNIEAAEKMGCLHDTLKEIGYTGHHLELYLVRLFFASLPMTRAFLNMTIL